VEALPDLAQHLPVSLNFDEAAAAHQDLFGFQLSLFESLFLTSQGLLGGATSEAVLTHYQRLGYTPTTQSGAADHLGEELLLLAHLTAAEAEALTDGKPGVAHQLQAAQRLFLEEHLLRWLAPSVVAIQRHKYPFFAEVAAITYSLVAEHYGALPAVAQTARAWDLTPPPALLDDPKTSLRDIAAFLTTPVYSGIFLSRGLINHLGRQHRLPHGFSSRAQMAANLLRSAAQYDAVPTLLGALRAEATTWQASYAAMQTAAPQLTPFEAPWLQRTAATINFLSVMDTALLSGQPAE
jgi:TorA maturation chaperone TorD